MPELMLPDGTKVNRPPTGQSGPGLPGRPRVEEYFVPSRVRETKHLSYSHKLAIDLLIEHPDWTQKELANYFGYSEMWVTRVVQSDAFQAKLAERRDELLNPEVRASIEERFRVLATTSLDRLQDKLANPNASDNLILRSVELAAKALGLGVRPQGPSTTVQVAIVVPPKSQPQGVVP